MRFNGWSFLNRSHHIEFLVTCNFVEYLTHIYESTIFNYTWYNDIIKKMNYDREATSMFENNSTSIVYTQTCVRLEYNYSLFTLPCQLLDHRNRGDFELVGVTVV